MVKLLIHVIFVYSITRLMTQVLAKKELLIMKIVFCCFKRV